MRLAYNLHRPPGINEHSITPSQLLHMATLAGARLTTFGAHIGALAPGRRADMILLDWDRITFPFVDEDLDPLEVLIHRARGSDVQVTIIDGKVVYENGRFLTLDADGITSEVVRQVQEPLSEETQKRRRLVAEMEPYLRKDYGSWPLKATPFYYHQSAC